MKEIVRQNERTTVSQERRALGRALLVTAIVAVFLAVSMWIAEFAAAAPIARSTPMQVEAAVGILLSPIGLLFIAFVLFIAGWGLAKGGMIKEKGKYITWALAAVVFFLAMVPFVGSPMGPATTAPGGQTVPWKFDLIPSVDTTGGDTIPAGNYDSCDTEAGGTTAEWTTTEGTFDPGTHQFVGRVAIDTDLAITAALWTEPNCFQMSFSAMLTNAADGPDDDSAVDTVSYYMRIVSISRTTLATDGSNGTLNTQGFVRDGVSETNDWYLLYRTDASVWVAACPEYRSAPSLGNSCGWVRVGDHAGGAADTFFAYLILEDRGLFGYQDPAVGSAVNIVYEFGGPDGRITPQQFTVVIILNSRGTTNLA